MTKEGRGKETEIEEIEMEEQSLRRSNPTTNFENQPSQRDRRNTGKGYIEEEGNPSSS